MGEGRVLAAVMYGRSSRVGTAPRFSTHCCYCVSGEKVNSAGSACMRAPMYSGRNTRADANYARGVGFVLYAPLLLLLLL